MTAPRPEPVLNWAAVIANWQRITAAAVGFVVAAGAVVVAAGWASQGQVEGWSVAVGGLLGAFGALLSVLVNVIGAQHTMAAAAAIREQVTPLEAPQNTDGHALVDAEYYGGHAAKRLIDGDVARTMGPDIA